MATTIAQIMTGLKDRLGSIAGLRAFDYAPDNPVPPCAFPLVPAIPSYREAMKRGTYIIPFRIAVLTSGQLDRTGQKALAGYADATGPTSIRAALEDTDRTLGALVNDLVVDSFEPSGLEDVGLAGYLGGTFSVRVIAQGG
ncbi:hypothetical protein [Salinispora pacifica]|uniref:hypothetical protein n=1 Tax=Salinispora pacifica TaxID=351187 RepID=UPI0004B7944F|nr:hypothetical protein [Salinispora pacifica]